MATYTAPIRDMKFVLYELLDGGSLADLPGYEEATPDLVDAVLEEGAKICQEVLFPINRSGDEEGCAIENGVVRTPKGFKEAYDTFIEGGWTSLACAPEYGGQGLPKAVNFIVEEMICSANLSFGMYPGLSLGAYNAIEAHGNEAIRNRYLPKLADGAWSGTMCLTEPHCGTDLGLIKTKAVPTSRIDVDGNRIYKISGAKIFISAGEHDLTENILHLVLAKLPDAPEGTRGISLFLVPKHLPNEDNSLGNRNGVSCGSIEHKMGIKASSTCAMNFDEAEGVLIGGENKGMSHMFVMMNAARLAVGIQGLGLAETSYQSAAEYAKERLQGRSLAGVKHPDKNADPIVVHPDVRRNLLTMRAYNEGGRALAYWVGMNIDRLTKHPDPRVRRDADDLVQLLTPVIKGFLTDTGFENANTGMQILGGHGFIREWGMEQLVRDARITQIYEGANGIQGLDLVGRKLGAHMGRYLRQFFHPVMRFIEEEMENEAMGEFVLPLAKAFGRLQQATAAIARKGMKDPEEAGAAATDYMRLFGLVALAYMWARMARVARAKLADGANGEAEFYKAKLHTGRFYMNRVLPHSSALFAQVMAGKDSLMAMEEEAF